MKTTGCSRGFTLAEVLVVMALFIILSGAMLSALLSTQQTWTAGSVEMMLTSELRKGLDAMSRELVQGQAGQILRPAANGAVTNDLVFRIPQDRNGDGTVLDANGQIAEWSNDISYSMNRTNSCIRSQVNDPGLLPRRIDTTLANHVNNLMFSRDPATPDVVQIQMAASTLSQDGRLRTRTMNTRVKLRN